MTWLHWSLDLPSVKWQQSCLPHSHRQNDASWQKKCQMSFSFFLVGASLPVSLHGREEVQPVKRYKVTSSSPKSHSLWICSECAILKSKYSLKKISQIFSIFHTIHKWASPHDPAPREYELWVCCGCFMSANFGWHTPHKEGTPWWGWSDGEKRNSASNLLKYIHFYNRNLYPKKSLPLIA